VKMYPEEERDVVDVSIISLSNAVEVRHQHAHFQIGDSFIADCQPDLERSFVLFSHRTMSRN
jgi:hypothetical protein